MVTENEKNIGVLEVSKKYSFPVDTENKAMTFPLFSVEKPHMRAFHLCWFQYFTCFICTFAAPPLLPIIRDNLNLTASDIGNAGVGSVSGAIFARLALGAACDLTGPRLASATVCFLTVPAVFLSSMASSPATFFMMRFFTGFSLATFVSTQYWMSCMFSPKVVGLANGQSGGWGNLGGGVANLLMPLLYNLILNNTMANTPFVAWRVAFFVPAFMQMFAAFAVMLLGQDLPDGNFLQLQKSGEMHKDNAKKIVYHAVTNYRGWITAIGYGFSFGVELAVNNIVVYYYYDRFNLNLSLAGIVGALFGMVNIFSRSSGGLFSDFMAKNKMATNPSQINLSTTFPSFLIPKAFLNHTNSNKMAKIIPYILYFTIFLCFYPTKMTSTTVSKEQIACTMCEVCENPCQPPPVVVEPPPPPPALPECPPPPSLTPTVPKDNPPPYGGISVPTMNYYSPPPPVGGGGGGGGAGGVGPYNVPSPPNPIVPYFPYYYYGPPPPRDHSSSTSLKSMYHFFVTCFLIFLNLFLR